MKPLKKIFSLSFFAAICFIIFKVFCFASKWICVHSESLFCPYTIWASKEVSLEVHNSFAEMFFHSDHSWFLYSFLYSFIEKNMPAILNLHPQEAIVISAKIILFPVFMVFLFTMTMPLFKYSKSRKLIYWGLGLFYSFFLVINALIDSDFLWVFYSCCWSIAYIFLSIFGIAFYNITEYFYVSEKKPSKIAIAIMTILFLCIAVSHEYYKFLCLIIIPIVYCLHHIVFKIKIEPKKFFKHVFIYVFTAFVCILNNLTYSYADWFLQHINKDESIISILSDKSFVLHYIESFINFLIINNVLYLVLIYVVSKYILHAVKDKNRNKRFIIFTYSTLFTAFFFFIAAIVGSESYDGYVNFALPQHDGLRCLFKFTLITIFLSEIGYLIKYHPSGIRKYIAVFGFAGLGLLSKNNFFLQIKPVHFFQKQVKTNLYIAEKMFILNKKINNNNIYYFYNNEGMFNDNGIVYLVNIYKSNYKPHEYSVHHVCLPEDNLDVCKDKMIQTAFEKTGYKFTEQEVKELNFSSLYELNK